MIRLVIVQSSSRVRLVQARTATQTLLTRLQ
jgi:hypothetical protein